MTPQISIFLRNFSSEIQEVNSLLVSAYVFINKLQVNNNTLIKELLIREEDSAQYKNLLRFIAIIRKTFTDFLLEDLIELFEFVISPAEKEVNGAVYTPERIRRYIVEATLGNFRNDQLENLKIADISCGCGGFFISVIEYIHHRIDVSLEQLFSNLYGVDIESYSIERTKILLSLFAIQNGEDIRTININLYNANSLNFNWNSIQGFEENGGFDVIVGNPPYVSSSKISEENKKYLQCWSVSSTGKADMYIPFFQIGIECLNARGILGYITVSNFYRSVNGRAFRIYMSEHQYSLKMIDFGAEQVFKNRSTYTCICLIKKQRGDIEYCQAKSNELDIIDNYRFTNILYTNLSNKRGWLLQNSNIIENIKISKGEESCLIWCVFYSLLEQVVEVLNVAEKADRETDQFNDLKYVFIDDPVSSLDENHLIELAVNIAELIKSSQSGLKFIITTHNPLFYNVLYNEFNNSDKRYSYKPKHSIMRRLEKMNDGTYLLVEQSADSPFSYHLFLLTELEKAIRSGEIKKYHYNFLRQILEKTSTFLGYTGWKELLPHDSQEAYYNRIINLCSHGKHSGEETSLIDDNDKRVLTFLVENVRTRYHFREEQAKDIEEDETV